jgi:hypothetical protein
VHTLKPSIRVVPASCKNGTGLDEIAGFLVPETFRANA